MAPRTPRNARDAATRYRTEREEAASPPPDAAAAGTPGAEDLPAIVETAIQQAIRQGAFDNLPGAGKPLPGLGGTHDPDWWIRRKIQTENLTGLGPPALVLRVEHARMEQTLDALYSEAEVREALEDFNARVVEARRQLLGGPPVVTPTRDVDAEVAAWRHRRAEQRKAAETQQAAPPNLRAPEARRASRRRGAGR